MDSGDFGAMADLLSQLVCEPDALTSTQHRTLQRLLVDADDTLFHFLRQASAADLAPADAQHVQDAHDTASQVLASLTTLLDAAAAPPPSSSSSSSKAADGHLELLMGPASATLASGGRKQEEAKTSHLGPSGIVTPWVSIGVLLHPAVDVHVYAAVVATLSQVKLLGHPDGSPFSVVTLDASEDQGQGQAARSVATRGGFTVTADATLETAPPLDVIIVPPVWDGTAIIDDPAAALEALGPRVVQWVSSRSKVAQFTVGMVYRGSAEGVQAVFSVRGALPDPEHGTTSMSIMLSRLASHWLGASGSMPNTRALTYTPY